MTGEGHGEKEKEGRDVVLSSGNRCTSRGLVLVECPSPTR